MNGYKMIGGHKPSKFWNAVKQFVLFFVQPGPFGWAYIAGATIGITSFADWSTPYLVLAFLVGGAAAFRGSALKNRQLEEARKDGYTDGVREGFNDGFDQGRDEGYDCGYAEGELYGERS